MRKWFSVYDRFLFSATSLHCCTLQKEEHSTEGCPGWDPVPLLPSRCWGTGGCHLPHHLALGPCHSQRELLPEGNQASMQSRHVRSRLKKQCFPCIQVCALGTGMLFVELLQEKKKVNVKIIHLKSFHSCLISSQTTR